MILVESLLKNPPPKHQRFRISSEAAQYYCLFRTNTYPLATLKQQHTYINFITTTIHYNKKKHSRPGVLQPTKIKSESPERESNPHTRFGRPVCCLCITRALTSINGHDRTRTCISRVKSPLHNRFATYPDVSYRIRTRIGGLEVLCPLLLNE